MEEASADSVIPVRSFLWRRTAVSYLKLKLNLKQLDATRCGLVVLLVNEILVQIQELFNKSIRLQCLSEDPVPISDMYKYLSVLLMSRSLGASQMSEGKRLLTVVS